jgi:ParB family chromosome partitioning protein
MSRRRGLGSGLDALLPSSPAGTSDAVRRLPVTAIRGNRSQPRTQFDEQALEELAASIREHGVIQPVIVSDDGAGGYELIAGERRWRAAQRAGLSELPAIVKSATPQQLLELAIVENVQRADLNALEEGLAYQTLKDEFGLSDEAISRRVGKSRVTVVNTRRLIGLGPAARQALLDGAITAGHGRSLLRFEAGAEQESALQLVLRHRLSVREAESLANLAHEAQLAGPVRAALLNGSISISQAQALLRVEESQMQAEVLDQVLALGLSVRETEQLADVVSEGMSMAAALRQVRPQSPPAITTGGAEAARATGAQARPAREPSAEDAEAQRMFEEILETPVQLVRSGGAIRLTVTLYSDEQLQQLYDRLSGHA